MVQDEAMELIYSVCRDKEEAQTIGRKLLEERIAACVNIFPIESLYWWQGELVHDSEAVMIVKTRRGWFQRVAERIAQLHSYSVPAVFSLPVEHVRESYLRWLMSETKGHG